MIVKANPAGILGTGHCVPEQVWTNEYLETFLDTSDEWIKSRTGIEARHFATSRVVILFSPPSASSSLSSAIRRDVRCSPKGLSSLHAP